MKALVVYESLFGNAEHVAQAITIGLSEHADVEGELARARVWGERLAEAVRRPHA